MRSDTLRVPGASIHYEVRGNGPLLLLIPGGGGDAAVVDPIADRLAEHFTVACLDPRGYSHSTIDPGEPLDQRVEVQSDDAYRLITHLTDEPAYLFGGSSGAIVGMDLLARHPDRVHRLVAHEPPCFAILPDADAQRAFIDEVYTLFRTEGMAAAGARFLQGIGGTMKPFPTLTDLPPRTLAMMARLQANAPIMMEHELRRFTSHIPDTAALTQVADRLVLAAGRETGTHLPARPAAVLATRLGIEVTQFPGGHSGFTDEPEPLATLLLETLLTPAPTP
ncbi:alpha/beta fold hydrolase [Nocardia sp. SYP-A9097]|uniref:alpha/beta fold hydrolase n=1 Tax=Nocardia sp. SYP-A9097 TaxID=2663237 RepID=UPI00129BD22F|nr:alpha/beta fold hydrolase [Nocardia sp. SYP-A9097]MRH90572.1 alpha/beta fold hydrolase [Nocardia sp. SYP-A9097]